MDLGFELFKRHDDAKHQECGFQTKVHLEVPDGTKALAKIILGDSLQTKQLWKHYMNQGAAKQ